ncbi:MAG: hypothetical protein AAFW89_14145 [Bacteroidota bacterium]
MYIRKLFIPFVCLVSLLFTTSAFAQFQGHIVMDLYSTNNGKTEINKVNMYVTSDRIMIQGDDEVPLTGGVSTSGLLVRNDKKDFVVMTGEKEALQITKSEIERFFEMASMMGGNKQSQVNDENAGYRYTDNTRTIMGKECAEMIIENEDEDGGYLSIWLTNGVDINWGMLSESWTGVPEDVDGLVNGLQQEFTGSNFPMLIEAHDKGKTYKVMEVTQLQKSAVAKAMVEIPSGVNLYGFGDLMMKMMMGN